MVIQADASGCHTQFDPLGRKPAESACDVMRTTLTDAGIPYSQPPRRVMPRRQVGTWVGASSPAGTVSSTPRRCSSAASSWCARCAKPWALRAILPRPITNAVRVLPVLGILVFMMLASTALYGPQAAALVELFPTRVRYTALSVPYNIGTGWVGGLLPVSAFALVAARGDIYAGLLYPLVFTAISIVCALLFLPETRGIDLARAGRDA